MLKQYIVAVGGSAGSLEPIKHFFDHTPLNNATYIVVRHLPKDYKSSLAFILKRHSKLQVLEAKQGMPILNNKIYYSPPNYYLTVYDGVLRLVSRNHHTKNKAVDILFDSLAKSDNCTKTIAIILSGIGSDGTEGAEAIKKAGGVVLVQSPESCEFSSMPMHVIEKGLADYILLPEEMPARIRGYADGVLADS